MNLEFFKDKTVLVTGHTGFKGSWLCEILYLAKAKVIGYALEPEEESLYNILNLDSKIISIYADIRNKKKLEQTIKKYKPEIIIHMAAQPLVLKSYEEPHYTFETNIMGTLNLLEVVRNNNCVKSFLNVTTDKVYLDKIDVNDEGYNEDDIICGKDPYSNSKSCSELITYSYIKSFFADLEYPRVSTARSGNVIGGGDFSSNRIIPDCVKAAVNNEKIIIRNPDSIRPYQHVLECLKGYLLIAEKQYNDKSYQGNYNFGPDGNNCVNTLELVKIFCDKWNDVEYFCLNENTKKESKYLKLNSNLAKNKLGWKPLLSIEESVDLVVKWSKCYYGNKDIVRITDKQIKKYFEDDVYEIFKKEGKGKL